MLIDEVAPGIELVAQDLITVVVQEQEEQRARVRIEFTEPMQEATRQAVTLRLGPLLLPIETELSPDRKTLQVTAQESAVEGALHTIELTSQARDLQGNPAEPGQWTWNLSATPHRIEDAEERALDPDPPSLVGNRWFFQGRELDPSTGLYDFRNRWYSAELGRWLTRDPLGYPDGPNQYAAFGANPAGGRDPLGLQFIGPDATMFPGFENHHCSLEELGCQDPLAAAPVETQAFVGAMQGFTFAAPHTAYQTFQFLSDSPEHGAAIAEALGYYSLQDLPPEVLSVALRHIASSISDYVDREPVEVARDVGMAVNPAAILRLLRSARLLTPQSIVGGGFGALEGLTPFSQIDEIPVPSRRPQPPDPGELRRPYLRVEVKREIERRAPRSPDGRPIDPNLQAPIDGVPDRGHKPGHEHWRERIRAERQGLTQDDFNDRMNNPELYQLEQPASNRSHRFEDKKSSSR